MSTPSEQDRQRLVAHVLRLLDHYAIPQKALATRSNLAPGTISKILRGESEGQPESLQKLAAGTRELVREAVRYKGLSELEQESIRLLDEFCSGRAMQVNPWSIIDRLESQPAQTHPFAMLATGHRLYFLLVRYPAGYANCRATVERIFTEHTSSNARGTSLFDLFGEYDLLIKVWVHPSELQTLRSALHAQGILDVRSYSVNWMSTPIQRAVDGQLEDPLNLTIAIPRHTGCWTVNRALYDALGNTGSASPLRFFVLFRGPAEEEVKMFEEILKRCRHAERALEDHGSEAWFDNYSLYSFLDVNGAGCILIGDTENWNAMQPGFFRLLASAGVADRKTTTLIRSGRSDVEDERPSRKSLERADIFDIPGLRLQAIDMALGLTELTHGTALHDRFKLLLMRDYIAESIVTYDPAYWWKFIHELRYLFDSLVKHRNGRVLSFFMLAYTRIEARLRELVMAHFRTPEEATDAVKKDIQYLILEKCGVLKLEPGRLEVVELLGRLQRSKPADGSRELHEVVKKCLGKCADCFEEHASKDAHIMLGAIPRIIEKIIEFGALPKNHWQALEQSRLQGWKTNLAPASTDRNKLMHGSILDVYKAPRGGASAWESLTANYIRVYPQVQWIARALEENLRALPEEAKILVGEV